MLLPVRADRTAPVFLRAVLAIAGGLSLGASCASMPEVVPKSATIVRVCPTRVQLRVEVELFNGNSAGGSVHSVELDVALANQEMPHISEKVSLFVPSKRWTTMALDVWVPASKVPNLMAAPLLMKDLPWSARGTVYGRAMGDSFSKTFAMNGVIKRDALIVMATKSAVDQAKSPLGWCLQ